LAGIGLDGMPGAGEQMFRGLQLRTANRMQIPPVLCLSVAGARRGMSGLPFAGAGI
jgi:hypothetical protein